MDDETLFHVRRGDLPWRASTLTECGLKLSANLSITRDELIARVKKNGQRKTELVACSTCFSTTQRYWGGADPVTQEDRETLWNLEREVNRHDRSGESKKRLLADMRAIGMLVARHREEFEELCEDIAVTVPIQKGRKVQ